MGVKVYLESPTGSWAIEIAYFENEDDYDVCYEALEAKAAIDGNIITESVSAFADE